MDRIAHAARLESGMSIEAIAYEFDRGPNTVAQIRRCRAHGFAAHVLTSAGRRYRCKRCRVAAVSARRRRVKMLLIGAAGGAGRLCGYDRCAGALQFQHVDPRKKAFAIADRGVARSLERALDEVRQVRAAERQPPR